MIREILRVGLLQCNCTVLGDEASGEAMVIDPGDDIPRIVGVLTRHQLTLKQIVITHAHIDHIAGAQILKRLTGAPVFYNQLDLPLVRIMDIQAGWLGIATPEVAPPDHSLEDGQIITVSGITGEILHTPGHTQGSVCMYLLGQRLLLAGDTLFSGGVGRTDLPGGDTPTLINSIQSRLMTLPEDTIVIPGHGAATTIGQEKECNPFLQSF